MKQQKLQKSNFSQIKIHENLLIAITNIRRLNAAKTVVMTKLTVNIHRLDLSGYLIYTIYRPNAG